MAGRYSAFGDELNPVPAGLSMGCRNSSCYAQTQTTGSEHTYMTLLHMNQNDGVTVYINEPCSSCGKRELVAYMPDYR